MNKPAIKILFAEDDVDDQELFKEALALISIPTQLTIARNGEILMKRLNDSTIEPPDIIFLDINMPYYDGIDCLTLIKSNFFLKDIPCVVLSTATFSITIKRASGVGADLYIIKPVKFENWIKAIEKVLKINWEEYDPATTQSFIISEKDL